MTDKTPLDNLNQSIANFEIADFNCEYSRAQIMKEDALVYIKHTEARIKELENALRQAKYTANVFEESSIRDAKVKNEFADKVRSYQTVVKEMQGRINVLEELMQWKPLDSAPKDGRIILLKGNDSHEVVVISDWWHSYANGDGHWECADAMDDFNPTNWMEMP